MATGSVCLEGPWSRALSPPDRRVCGPGLCPPRGAGLAASGSTDETARITEPGPSLEMNTSAQLLNFPGLHPYPHLPNHSNPLRSHLLSVLVCTCWTRNQKTEADKRLEMKYFSSSLICQIIVKLFPLSTKYSGMTSSFTEESPCCFPFRVGG